MMSAETSVRFPWRIAGFEYGQGVIELHQEIEHFHTYIQPTAIEIGMRYSAIKRTEELIRGIWSYAKIEVYGSFRTGMHLPGSDIDMTVLGVDDAVALFRLESELVEHAIAVPDTLIVLDKATVPVVKFTDSETYLKFDISFNVETGVQAAKLMKEFKWQYPNMPKLVMVLKQFLQQHKLNEVYTGGISSYALTLMCISFLQVQRNSRKVVTKNLGVLLLKFLDYYGRKFDYCQYAISVRNGNGYIAKTELQTNADMYCQSILTIEDPIVPGNDVGRLSFCALFAKQLFECKYFELSKIVDSEKPHTKPSILGCMLEISGDVFNYREWARSNFGHLVPQRHKQQQQQQQHKQHQQQRGTKKALRRSQQNGDGGGKHCMQSRCAIAAEQPNNSNDNCLKECCLSQN